MSIGSFGNMVFETSAEKICTWSQLKRSGQARFAKHDVLGGKPMLQFLGADLEEFELTVRLDVALGINPMSELENLREVRAAGNYNDLFIGPQKIGRYVLESFSETWLHTDNRGNLLVAECTMKLREYHDRTLTVTPDEDLFVAPVESDPAKIWEEDILIPYKKPDAGWGKMLDEAIKLKENVEKLYDLGLQITEEVEKLDPEAFTEVLLEEISKQVLADQIKSLTTIFGEKTATELIKSIDKYLK